MKKLFSMLLACLLALTLPVLAESTEAFSPVGTWYLIGASAQGVTVSPEQLGMEMSITLNEDGTALLTLTGEEDSTGSWTSDGSTVTVDDGVDVIELSVNEDGTLSGEAGGAIMIFATEIPEATPAAAPLEAVALEDFNGEWVAVKGMMMGVEVSLESLGMNMSLLIEDGAITPTTDGVAEETVQGTLEGNALLFTDDGVTVGLQLYEDGTMAFTLDLSGSSIDIVFEKTEAAAE